MPHGDSRAILQAMTRHPTGKPLVCMQMCRSTEAPQSPHWRDDAVMARGQSSPPPPGAAPPSEGGCRAQHSSRPIPLPRLAERSEGVLLPCPLANTEGNRRVVHSPPKGGDHPPSDVNGGYVDYSQASVRDALTRDSLVHPDDACPLHTEGSARHSPPVVACRTPVRCNRRWTNG